jgi:hypothetical protein
VTIILLLLGFVLSYELYAVVIMGLIVEETVSIFRVEVTRMRRQPLHIQSTVVLSFLPTLLLLFGPPKDWPFNVNIFIGASVFVWAYLNCLYELSYKGGVRSNIRKGLKWICNWKRLPFKAKNHQRIQQRQMDES